MNSTQIAFCLALLHFTIWSLCPHPVQHCSDSALYGGYMYCIEGKTRAQPAAFKKGYKYRGTSRAHFAILHTYVTLKRIINDFWRMLNVHFRPVTFTFNKGRCFAGQLSQCDTHMKYLLWSVPVFFSTVCIFPQCRPPFPFGSNLYDC